MAKLAAADVLAELTGRTQEHLATAQAYRALDDETLLLRPRPQSWHTLDCLAHLNHYGDFYLPEFRKQIAQSRFRQDTGTFTPGILGNYFAQSMKPAPGGKKFTSPRAANPANFAAAPEREVITTFIHQQEALLDILQQAAAVNLTKTRTATSISPLLRLRLGDTLRVIVYHNWRHLEQAAAAQQS